MADEPNKYRFTFTDRDGVEESHYIVVVPDPGSAELVKSHIMQKRDDLKLRGVTADKLHVEKVGPQTPADMARVGRVLSGVESVVAPRK